MGLAVTAYQEKWPLQTDRAVLENAPNGSKSVYADSPYEKMVEDGLLYRFEEGPAFSRYGLTLDGRRYLCALKGQEPNE